MSSTGNQRVSEPLVRTYSVEEHAEEILRRAGCPKINLQVRSKNKQAADFYADLGYLRDDVISFGKRLDPD